MNFIKFLGNQTSKYLKGLFAVTLLWLFAATGIFIFDSCKKTKYENSKYGEAARKFNNALDESKVKIGSIALASNNNTYSRTSENTGSYYLDFPTGTSPEIITDFSSNVTIASLSNILTNYGVTIDDSTNINADLIIQVPEEPIRQALQPLVGEAKNYLMAKGATDQQIMDMLQEEGAEEIDLIPFVKVLTSIEQDQYTVRKFNFPFIHEANALPHFVECGIQALGGDAAYALAHSGASSWTWATMKSVFKSVAKRFLGPIGVAIAVVTFTVCMLN